MNEGMLNKLESAERVAEIALTAFSWMVTIFLTLMIVIDVSGRFLFNRPLPATWELGEICMPYIVFFPFAYALRRDNHVRVLLIRNQFSPGVQRGMKIFTDGLSLLMCAFLTYYSWLRFWESYTLEEEMLAAVRILWWWGKIAMPVGMGAFTLAYFLQLFHAATRGGRKQA
jgi:TRAP-type C4-dicarboxylate transport system permease small subunit